MPLLLYSWTYDIIFGQGNLDVMQKPEYPAIYKQTFCKFQDFCVRSRLLFRDKLTRLGPGIAFSSFVYRNKSNINISNFLTLLFWR